MLPRATIVLGKDEYRNGRPLLSYFISPPALLVAAFSILYTVAILYLSHASSRDPTSYFFDRDIAYQPRYTTQRTKEADAFIAAAAHVSPRHEGVTPLLCIGIATVARRTEQYVRATVGSVLEGLSEKERKSIFLNILIGHTQPSEHPIYSEKWVETLPDRVLYYQQDTEDYTLLQEWEQTEQYRNKTIYDYTYLMKNCYETGAKYVVMLEDDTLAMRDWYPRAVLSIDLVEDAMKASSPEQKWLYLRLFYMDELLGWNSENWPTYLSDSCLVFGLALCLMTFARRCSRWARLHVTTLVMLTTSFVCIPASIALFFMAGRLTVSPPQAGIHQMDKYGCCSQALVFPREIVPEFLAKTDLVTDWLVDMMIEQIADATGLLRWMTVPSLFQHIGATSSKGFGFDNSAKDIWNFGFELHKDT